MVRMKTLIANPDLIIPGHDKHIAFEVDFADANDINKSFIPEHDLTASKFKKSFR